MSDAKCAQIKRYKVYEYDCNSKLHETKKVFTVDYYKLGRSSRINDVRHDYNFTANFLLHFFKDMFNITACGGFHLMYSGPPALIDDEVVIIWKSPQFKLVKID